MRVRVLAVICLGLALASGMAGLAAGILGLKQASKASANTRVAVAELRLLLLDGKTASAISAKKTAVIVKGIQGQLSFDHQSTVRGQKALVRAERDLEQHLDVTIKRAVEQAAIKAAEEFRGSTR